jgi:hypothetical protein
MRSLDGQSPDGLTLRTPPDPFPLFKEDDICQSLRTKGAEKQEHRETDDAAQVVVPPPAPELRDGGTDDGCRHGTHEGDSGIYGKSVTTLDGVVNVIY